MEGYNIKPTDVLIKTLIFDGLDMPEDKFMDALEREIKWIRKDALNYYENHHKQ